MQLNCRTAALRAVPQGLFPTMDSLKDFDDYITTQLPITDKNKMMALLRAHQNTILNQFNQVSL